MITPQSSLQRPGLSRRSLIEKSQDVQSALVRTLDRLSDQKRRFFYMDLSQSTASGVIAPACFLLAHRDHGLAVNGRSTELVVTTYFIDPRFLKQESEFAHQVAALGWQVSRRRVETAGHAVELITKRVDALGWCQG